MIALLLTLGCDVSERDALDAARGDALAAATAARTGWVADASLTFPLVELEAMATALLDDALARVPDVSGPMGGVALRVAPTLRVQTLHLEPDPGRTDALLARGTLVGTLGAAIGGRELGVPVTVGLTLRLRLEVVDGLAVMLRIDDVDSVAVEVGGWKSKRARKGEQVEAALRERVKNAAPHATLAAMGERGLPIVAARLHADGPLVRVELRTTLPDEGPPIPEPSPASGAALAMSDRAFTAIVRREIWEKQGANPAPFLDPVLVDLGGDRFRARVRLWNPGWPVWWQDFSLEGPLALTDERVRVSFDRIDPGAGSGWLALGRVLADPLLDGLAVTVGGRLAASLPGELSKQLHGVKVAAQLAALHDAPDAFILEADVAATGL